TRATSTSGSGPVTPGSTATTTVMSGSGPGGTGAFDVRLQLTTDPLTAVQSQPLPSALTRVVPGESSSVTVTPPPDDGPLFSSDSVWVALPAAVAEAGPSLVPARSAAASTVGSASSALLDRSGSCVGLSASAVLRTVPSRSGSTSTPIVMSGAVAPAASTVSRL